MGLANCSIFLFGRFYIHLSSFVFALRPRLLLKLNFNVYYMLKCDIGHLNIQAGPVLCDYDCQTITIIIVKFVYPVGIVFMPLYPYNAV